MASFHYVKNTRTQLVLEGKYTTPEDLEHAIKYTAKHHENTAATADRQAFAIREIALRAVDEYWNVPSVKGVLANLRVYWRA